MPVIDDYADLYLNFQDSQEWLADRLASMTMAEYIGFVGYCFDELNLAGESKEGGEFCRVKGLILALARKDLETARFMTGLTDEQRATALRTAAAYYELAKGFYPAEAVQAVEAAWTSSLEHGERFGWPSPGFAVLPPRAVFRDQALEG